MMLPFLIGLPLLLIALTHKHYKNKVISSIPPLAFESMGIAIVLFYFGIVNVYATIIIPVWLFALIFATLVDPFIWIRQGFPRATVRESLGINLIALAPGLVGFIIAKLLAS